MINYINLPEFGLGLKKSIKVFDLNLFELMSFNDGLNDINAEFRL